MEIVRDATSGDEVAVLGIVEGSGAFDADGLAYVRETLVQHLSRGSEGIWLVADTGEPVAVAYCIPEPVAPGVWNLLMLWARPDQSGKGYGRALVSEIERRLTLQCARMLLVETSSLDSFAVARRFYAKCGFAQEAVVREFYAVGDDKIILTKRLAPVAT